MSLATPLRGFSNIGWQGVGRNFIGFPAKPPSQNTELGPRGLLRLDMCTGDLVSFTGAAAQVWLFAFDDKGRAAHDALGLETATSVDLAAVNAGPLIGWSLAQGGTAPTAATEIAVSDLQVFKASAAVTLWVALPVRRRVSGGRTKPAASDRPPKATGARTEQAAPGAGACA